MLYAKNGATDAEIRCYEHEHMDLKSQDLGKKIEVNPRVSSDLDLAHADRGPPESSGR